MEYIITILSGILVCLPLVLKLIEYVNKSIESKNYHRIVTLILQLMETAENNFNNGADRKTWVLSEVKALCTVLGMEYDQETYSALIDELCVMSKVVNPPA